MRLGVSCEWSDDLHEISSLLFLNQCRQHFKNTSFLTFPEKHSLTLHIFFVNRVMICMKCQTFFPEKINTQKIFRMSSATIISLLMLSSLGKISADDILKYFFFLIFTRKQALTVHANCLELVYQKTGYKSSCKLSRIILPENRL